MAISFMDGFDHYDGEGQVARGNTSALLKVRGECSYIGPGLRLEVDILPGGKWSLRVNGVEMIFDRRPEFTIPQPQPANP